MPDGKPEVCNLCLEAVEVIERVYVNAGEKLKTEKRLEVLASLENVKVRAGCDAHQRVCAPLAKLAQETETVRDVEWLKG